METEIKVVIADADEEFRELLSNALNDEDDIWAPGTAANGDEALLLLKRDQPDVLVLDLDLPQIDGVEVMCRMRMGGIKPVVIVVSSSFNQRTLSLCSELGVFYCLPKPCDIEKLIEQIRRGYLESHPLPSFDAADQRPGNLNLELDITEVLHELGVPAHLRGYNYLREAILLTVADTELLNAVTKKLYPAVAKKSGATPAQVEHAVRRAIETAWDRGNLDTLQKYFGYTVSTERGKPTNCEFLAMLTDCILLRYKVWRTQNKDQ